MSCLLHLGANNFPSHSIPNAIEEPSPLSRGGLFNRVRYIVKGIFNSLFSKIHVFNKGNESSIKHNIGRIKNQGQDCFIITTLYELAHIENFQPMLTKLLKKGEEETEDDFQIRIRLQNQLKTIVGQIREGKGVPNQHIIELRKTLVDIGFSPPLTKIQKILSWVFPGLFSYKAGDLFELYNTIRYQLDEKDYYIPTATHAEDRFFQKNLSPPDGSLIHLFLNNEEDMNLLQSDRLSLIPQASRVGVKMNANWKNQKIGILPTFTSSGKRFDLTLVQCTLPQKFMGIWNVGYHSMSFLKKDDQWYSCNDHRIQPVCFDDVREHCAKGVLHLHYQST